MLQIRFWLVAILSRCYASEKESIGSGLTTFGQTTSSAFMAFCPISGL